MPLYEYHCQACGYEFEAIVPFAQADAVSCESCGSERVERLASSFCAAGTGADGASAGDAPPCFSGG